MPPAGTVFCVHPVCTPPENTGLQQPTWIVPGVLGARCLFEIRPSVGEDRERPRGAIVVAGKDAGPVACSAREGPRTPPAAASAPRGAIVVAGKDAGPVACSASEGP